MLVFIFVLKSKNKKKLAYNRCNYSTTASSVSKLTQIDTLPRSQVQSTICDRNCKTYSGYGRFCMCRHIIITLQCMFVIGFAFLNQPIENSIKIGLYIWIGTLLRTYIGG